MAAHRRLDRHRAFIAARSNFRCLILALLERHLLSTAGASSCSQALAISVSGIATTFNGMRVVRYQPKNRRIRGSVWLLLVSPSRADSLSNNHVINHARTACVYVINTHASAGLDRGFDQFAILVHDMPRPLENITTRGIRAVLANNERFGRLITGGPRLPQASF